jgi:hypothetical protein
MILNGFKKRFGILEIRGFRVNDYERVVAAWKLPRRAKVPIGWSPPVRLSRNHAVETEVFAWSFWVRTSS